MTILFSSMELLEDVVSCKDFIFFFFSVGEKMQGKIERPLCCGLWLEKLDINPRLSRNFSPLH